MNPKMLMMKFRVVQDDALQHLRKFQEQYDQVMQFRRQAEAQSFESQLVVNSWVESLVNLQQRWDDCDIVFSQLSRMTQDSMNRQADLIAHNSQLVEEANKSLAGWQSQLATAKAKYENAVREVSALESDIGRTRAGYDDCELELGRVEADLRHCQQQAEFNSRNGRPAPNCSRYYALAGYLRSELNGLRAKLDNLDTKLIDAEIERDDAARQVSMCHEKIELCQEALQGCKVGERTLHESRTQLQQQKAHVDAYEKSLYEARMKLDDMRSSNEEMALAKQNQDGFYEEMNAADRDLQALLEDLETQCYLVQRNLDEKADLLQAFDRRLFG